MKKQEPVMEI